MCTPFSEMTKRTRSPAFTPSASRTDLGNVVVLFAKTLDQAKITNLKVGKIVRPDDPLYSVARGCLIAAENAK